MENNIIITGMNWESTRYALINLHKEGIINIKKWIGLSPSPETPDHKIGRVTDDVIIEPLRAAFRNREKYQFIKYDLDVYDIIKKQYLSFYNIQIRNITPIDYYEMEQDFNVNFNYWYKFFIDNDIDVVLNGEPAINEDSWMCYAIAKSMHVTVLTFWQGVSGLFTVNTSQYKIGYTEFINHRECELAYVNIEKKFEKDLYYMKKIEPYYGMSHTRILHNIWGLFSGDARRLMQRIGEESRGHILEMALELLGCNLLQWVQEKRYVRRKYSYRYLDFDTAKKYVYFPLHLKPEATTDALGGEFSDQLLAIERLREFLPKDWWIFVKENPKQSYWKRGDSFFKRLERIPNTGLVDFRTQTYDLIKYSQFIATITGTVGWEAITGGKPALIFGSAWYRSLPGVFEYKNNPLLNDIVSCKINHEELEIAYNKLRNNSFDGVIVSRNYTDCDPLYTVETNTDKVSTAIKQVLVQLGKM